MLLPFRAVRQRRRTISGADSNRFALINCWTCDDQSHDQWRGLDLFSFVLALVFVLILILGPMALRTVLTNRLRRLELPTY